MFNYQNNALSSTILGFSLGAGVTAILNIIHKRKEKKLANEKLKTTDSLNQKIGYEQCNIDELKERKKKLTGKKIIRNATYKRQLQEIDAQIKKSEFAIKNYEKRIEKIRSCPNLETLRVILNPKTSDFLITKKAVQDNS